MNLTQAEKRIILFLAGFLIVGIVVRIMQERRAKVDFKVVHTGEMPEKNNKHYADLLQRKKVDLNKAQLQDFERLQGIGPKMAEAIVQYRNKYGGFKNPEEIIKVRGFGKRRFEKLKNYLFVEGKSGAANVGSTGKVLNQGVVSKKKVSRIIHLNNASAAELDSLPHIGKTLAARIVEYRKAHGLFKEKTDLLRVPGITVSLYNKIESYLVLH